MAIRISGIVRAARTVQGRLQHGIPEWERTAFLADAAEQVRAIDMVLDDLGACVEDLPVPSQRAYAVLRAAAAMTPDVLPLSDTTAPVVKPLRIPGLVGALRAQLGRLATQPDGEATVEQVQRTSAAHAERVRAICAEERAAPSGLPKPSAQAFGMLAWLAVPENTECYARQHALAMQYLEPVLLAASPGRILRLTFEPGRNVHALRKRGRLLTLKLSVGYLAAAPSDFADLAEAFVQRDALPPALGARYRAFHGSEPSAAVIRAVDELWRPSAEQAGGRTYNLDVIFRRLNAAYFEGRMARPQLVWEASLSSRRFGTYTAAGDRVVIDARLDDPAVPEFVAECVLFHELLHKHYGTPEVAGRRRVHPPHFKQHELEHPRFEESERWLAALAAGERAPLD